MQYKGRQTHLVILYFKPECRKAEMSLTEQRK